MPGDSLRSLLKTALQFRDERDWAQFHTFKDLAVTLALEAAEVLEHAQWKSEKDIRKYLKQRREHVADELADVLHVLLLLAEHAEIDLAKAFEQKMKKNRAKYPIEKARGSAKKYTEL